MKGKPYILYRECLYIYINQSIYLSSFGFSRTRQGICLIRKTDPIHLRRLFLKISPWNLECERATHSMLRRHPVERWWLCIHVASALPGNMAAGLNWNKASILKLTWPMGFPTFCQATCLHRTICPQKGGHGIFYAVVKSLFVAIFAPWVSTKNSEQIFFWHTLRVKPSRFQMICSQVASRWYGESACWLAAPFGTSSNLAMKERETVIHWYVLQPWVCVYIYTPVCNVEIYI